MGWSYNLLRFRKGAEVVMSCLVIADFCEMHTEFMVQCVGVVVGRGSCC